MIRIIAIGKIKDPNIRGCFEEYRKRLGRFTRIEVVELKEEDMVRRHIKDDALTIALDKRGDGLSSKELAGFIKENHLTRDLVFLVGGPDGLKEEVLKRADHSLSLSEMTFTSQMARLILIEQIYRAFTIINGVKYHR